MTIPDLIAKLEVEVDGLEDEDVGRLICEMHGVEFSRASSYTGDDGSDELAVHSVAGVIWQDYRSVAPDLDINVALDMVQELCPGKSVLMGLRQTPETKPWARIGEWREADAAAATLAGAICIALLKAVSAARPRAPRNACESSREDH